jgi:hypothetical protein
VRVSAGAAWRSENASTLAIVHFSGHGSHLAATELTQARDVAMAAPSAISLGGWSDAEHTLAPASLTCTTSGPVAAGAPGFALAGPQHIAASAATVR